TDFPHIRPSVTGMLASVAPRLRQATVTCSYPDQVTIYNCRISKGVLRGVSRVVHIGIAETFHKIAYQLGHLRLIAGGPFHF
ncbi:MAG: hypothetical protein ACRDPY_30885, partial [Streptosporangiaceae bacterium]